MGRAGTGGRRHGRWSAGQVLAGGVPTRWRTTPVQCLYSAAPVMVAPQRGRRGLYARRPCDGGRAPTLVRGAGALPTAAPCAHLPTPPPARCSTHPRGRLSHTTMDNRPAAVSAPMPSAHPPAASTPTPPPLRLLAQTRPSGVPPALWHPASSTPPSAAERWLNGQLPPWPAGVTTPAPQPPPRPPPLPPPRGLALIPRRTMASPYPFAPRVSSSCVQRQVAAARKKKKSCRAAELVTRRLRRLRWLRGRGGERGRRKGGRGSTTPTALG